MKQKSLVSIVESSMHPNYSALYVQKGLIETRVNSIRKAISLVKKTPVDYLVAEFFYAYSTNYSGVHKSNLDVLLISLAKYSPHTRVIVLVEKKEYQYVEVLNALNFPLHAVLIHPVRFQQIEDLLR
ncbi:MAG: hypothetical protein ISR73_10620 [Gammaproteobacteria bacterium]|nr:hypothetical protein [Gammaproteobacteria bacterium]